MTLRYYAKRIGNNYELLNNQVPFVKDEISVKALKFIGKLPPFVEIFFDVNNGEPVIKTVKPLYVTNIGYDAIKATVNHNEAELRADEPGERHSVEFINERKEMAQQVLDRVMLYGDKFENALEELLEKFPMTVSFDATYRKVQIKAS